MKSQEPTESVEVYKLRIPVSALAALDSKVRYSYYLLGHMFNELMFLQKMASFSLPKHEDLRDIRRSPELSQAMCLFRLASSKINEIANELKKNSALKSTLDDLIIPKMPKGVQRHDEVLKAIENADWLPKLRNKIGFHFPNFAQLESHIQPDESWSDDYIYMSSKSGNVFYDAANTVMLHWTFKLYSSEVLPQTIDSMIMAMIDLIKLMSSYVEDAVGVLISETIITITDAPELAGEVFAPSFDKVEIPFWTSMPPAEGKA